MNFYHSLWAISAATLWESLSHGWCGHEWNSAKSPHYCASHMTEPAPALIIQMTATHDRSQILIQRNCVR